MTPADADEEAILTIVFQDGMHRILTLQDMDRFPQVEIRTATPWDQGVQVFSGPSLNAVLAEFGLTGGTILARAINNYEALLETENHTSDYPILATRRDGIPMTVRDKGPVFIVFPYDRLGHEDRIILRQSVWQLERLVDITGL